MIIPNGTIEMKRKTPTGIDRKTGYPVRPSEAQWGDPIPCQIVPVKHDALAMTKQGEAITAATWQVYVDEQRLEGEQLRLSREDGSVIGEYSVIHFEPLQAVCEIRIWI